MNFLTLTQRLHSEAGIAGTTPATAVGQTGMIGRIVNWVLSGYEDVQNLHPEWKFLQTSFSFPTVAATQNYTPATLGYDSLNLWKVSDVRAYSVVADETELAYLQWDDFRSIYKTGSNRSLEARPSVFSIKPDNSMDLWPTPDAVYTINGEYFKEPQTMALDADIPIIPSAYHMIIVWRGLMFYGAKSGAQEVYAHGYNEYRHMLRRLEMNQLARITFGAPLA